MRNLFYLNRKQLKLPLIRGLTFLLLSFILSEGHLLWAAAQTPTSGITQPASGDTVSGVVIVQGTAVHPDYLRYELAFLQESNSEAGWIVFAEGDQQVINGTLAVWDTTVGRDIGAPVFPDGRYQLRLRVVKSDYNYDEYFVTNLTVATAPPTPTPTATVTAVPAEGATVIAPSGTVTFQQPTALPSLTPFPTPTPARVVAGGIEASGPQSPPEETGPDADSGGLLAALAAIETGRFRRAFWLGALISGAIFVAVGLYLLLRAAGRRLWRLLWTRLIGER